MAQMMSVRPNDTISVAGASDLAEKPPKFSFAALMSQWYLRTW